MKKFCLSLALLALAACSGTQSTPAVPNLPSSFDTLGNSLGAQADSTRAGSKSVAIKSIGISATVNGKFYPEVFLAVSCTATDVGGVAKGCALGAKVALTVTSLTASLFSGAQGKGCKVAIGRFHGRVAAGKVIPIVFKWTGKC